MISRAAVLIHSLSVTILVISLFSVSNSYTLSTFTTPHAHAPSLHSSTSSLLAAVLDGTRRTGEGGPEPEPESEPGAGPARRHTPLARHHTLPRQGAGSLAAAVSLAPWGGGLERTTTTPQSPTYITNPNMPAAR